MSDATVTDEQVRALLARLRSNRPVEYLCRAFLQFGPDAMINIAAIAKVQT